jgi:hypothetical protein
MPSMLYRLFGLGRFPEAIASFATEPTTLLARDDVRMTVKTHALRLKSRRVSNAVGLQRGAVAISPDRFVLTISKRVAIDGQYDATSNDRAVAWHFADHTLHITVDIARADPNGTGTMTVVAAIPMTPQEHAGLPTTPQFVAMDPDGAVIVTRWS